MSREDRRGVLLVNSDTGDVNELDNALLWLKYQGHVRMVCVVLWVGLSNLGLFGEGKHAGQMMA